MAAIEVLLQAIPPATTLLSEVILIGLIAIVLYVIFQFGRSFVKLLMGLIMNSVLGLIAIVVLNYLFNLAIPLKLYTLIPTALFGLPAVGTLVILRYFGVTLAILL